MAKSENPKEYNKHKAFLEFLKEAEQTAKGHEKLLRAIGEL